MFEELISRWGYVAIVIGAFFEGEAVLIAAGALAHRGLLSLPLVMLAASAGSVAGDQLWFHLGRRWGPSLLERRPAWKARAAGIQERVRRSGNSFVFGFRFIYGIRTVTPALLGVSGYPGGRFTMLNGGGALVWAIAVGTAGWALGAALARVLERAARIEELLLAAAVLAAALWMAWRAHAKARFGRSIE
ncbi:MAG TPA: DedA family protein [Polyangiaceae bacterium]